MEHCIGLLGKRANLPVACLAVLAAFLAELEGFRHAGLSIIFVVDDNLIGNKKAIKPPHRKATTGSRRSWMILNCPRRGSPRRLRTLNASMR